VKPQRPPPASDRNGPTTWRASAGGRPPVHAPVRLKYEGGRFSSGCGSTPPPEKADGAGAGRAVTRAERPQDLDEHPGEVLEPVENFRGHARQPPGRRANAATPRHHLDTAPGRPPPPCRAAHGARVPRRSITSSEPTGDDFAQKQQRSPHAARRARPGAPGEKGGAEERPSATGPPRRVGRTSVAQRRGLPRGDGARLPRDKGRLTAPR